MTLPRINFLHLTLGPRQDFKDQGHYSKAKGQITVTPWHCAATPCTNVHIKCEPSIPYRFRDIARTRLQTLQSLQDQRTNQGHTMTLHTYTPPHQCPKYRLPTPYFFLRYSADKTFKVKATMAWSTSNQGHTMTLHTYTA